ncbi:MAG: hypothetical protein Q4D38_03050 [Planctomycetia bacterium]|nr:hypothetical protein [Planctomycetia bacterium]
MRKLKCQSCEQIFDVAAFKPNLPCPKCSSKLTPSNAEDSGVCAACGKTAAESDVFLFCPECGKGFHVDCWNSNFGCSTYECSYFEVLKPMEIAEPVAPVRQSSFLQDEALQKAQEKAREEEELERQKERQKERLAYEGPILQDPLLLPKLKSYAVFAFGGMMAAAVLFASVLVVGYLLLWTIGALLGIKSPIFFSFVLFLLVGAGAGVYFAHRNLDTLLSD